MPSNINNPGDLSQLENYPKPLVQSDRAQKVSDINNPAGILRTHFIDVVHATLPTEAGSGTIVYDNGPVDNPKITSIYVSAGSLPLTANNNWIIRYAIDSANDTEAGVLLPTTFPTASEQPVAGQVMSFNPELSYVPDTEAAGDLRVVNLIIPNGGIEIPVLGVSRLDFAHNFGAGVTVILGVSATEQV